MAPLPLEQVIFQTLRSLCESLGFDYHITLVNVDDPADRHWSASENLVSSPRILTDFAYHAAEGTEIRNPFETSASSRYPWLSASSAKKRKNLAFKNDNFDEFHGEMTLDTYVKTEAESLDELIDSDEHSSEVGQRPIFHEDQDGVTVGAPYDLDQRCLPLGDGVGRNVGHKTRKRMSLRRKLEVLHYIETGNGRTEAAKHFGISRKTINNVWKNRERIKTHFRNGMNLEKRGSKISPFSALDEPLRDWYTRMKERNVPVTGYLIQDEALKIAEKLNIEGFSASAGWLDRFKQRWNIKLKDK